MNIGETLTQKWLRQNVQSYPRRERVYADVDAVISRFPTIRPKTDVYTYDDGRTQLLLCVHGLLPITFRQSSYNIPVDVWVTHDYPQRPPIVYVVPTSDMMVRAGKYMDVSGRCHIQYLQDWERKSEACNLLSLVEALQEHFSREPPVYARPPSSPALDKYNVHVRPQLSMSSSNHRPPPIPPKPGSSVSSEFRPGSTRVPWPDDDSHNTSPNAHSPSRPPRPPSMMSLPGPGLPLSTDSPVGPPPFSHNRSASINNVNVINNANTHPSRTPSPFVPSPNHRWSMPPSRGGVAYHASPLAERVPTTPLSPHTHGSVPLPPSQPPFPPTVVSPPPLMRPYFSQARPHSPPVLPPNFLDEDSSLEIVSSPPPRLSAAPPRPMNPELVRLHAEVHAKLTSEYASLAQAMAQDADRLRAHQRDLLLGEPAIRDEMARLEAVKDVCLNVASRFRGAVNQAERNVSELRKKGDPEVDELICSTTIVHNQLINLVAEDNAIEDTIYHLHRALNTGRIDLERFLRTTRVLAEEQFMKKAIIEKIQAGLPMSQWS